MTDKQKQEQLKRLLEVSPHEWREVREALARRTTERLNATLIRGIHGEPKLVGGRTLKGAHSDIVLRMNAFDYYTEEPIIKLFDCKWEWRPDLSIKDQVLIVLDSMISKQAEKFQRQAMKQVDLNVENIKEEEEPIDEVQFVNPSWYNEAREEVKDEPELVQLMDAINRFPTPRERCQWLGIDGRQYENLRKKIGRRLKKYTIK